LTDAAQAPGPMLIEPAAALGGGYEQPLEDSEAASEASSVQDKIDKELRIRAALEVSPGDLIDPLEYAKHRKSAPIWFMVEIGPANHPNGLNRQFTGLSYYIGLENFSYYDYSNWAKEAFGRLRRQRTGENIVLQPQMSFGRNLRDPSEENLRYDLPDAIADEVYVSRVYDKTKHRTCERNHDEQVMTNEIARMLAPGAMAVIFDYARNAETIAEMLTIAGLRLRFASRDTQFGIEAGRYDHSNSDRHEDIIDELGGHAGDMLLIASK